MAAKKPPAEKPADTEPTSLPTPAGAALATCVETLLENWSTNRVRLEDKWQRNWDNYIGAIYDPWKKGEGEGDRSDTHIQVTKSRVMMAYALVIDLVLQGGEIPVDLPLGKWQGLDVDAIPPPVRTELERRAKSMKARIRGQLAMGAADRELSKAILSQAIFGEGYLKIVVRDFEEGVWEIDANPDEDAESMPGTAEVWTRRTVTHRGPALTWVPVWDIYRDMEETDLRKGKGFIHRKPQSPYWLRSRIGKPYYRRDAIMSVLAKHTGESDPASGVGSTTTEDVDSLSPGLRNVTHRTKTLGVYEFWGRLPREQVEAFEAEVEGRSYTPDTTETTEGDEVECHVIVCDNEVVRFVRTSVKDRPVYRGVWEEGLEPDEALGVADNVQDLQKVVNGAFRSMEDNIRQVCNVVWALKEQAILNSAEIKKNGMQPGTVVWLKEGIQSINEVIQQLQSHDVTGPLTQLISMCLTMLDTDSMIPRTQMGTGDRSRSTTAYEVSQQIANSSKYIGAVIRRIDECLIEPIINYFYDYAMRDPDFPDKGNFVVKATGYQNYHDRLQVFDQVSRLMAQWLSNPMTAVHTNVRNMMQAQAKALDQAPETAMVPEEQATQLLAAMQTDPLKQAQQAKAEADARAAQAKALKDMNDIKVSLAQLRMAQAETAQRLRSMAAAEAGAR